MSITRYKAKFRANLEADSYVNSIWLPEIMFKCIQAQNGQEIILNSSNPYNSDDIYKWHNWYVHKDMLEYLEPFTLEFTEQVFVINNADEWYTYMAHLTTLGYKRDSAFGISGYEPGWNLYGTSEGLLNWTSNFEDTIGLPEVSQDVIEFGVYLKELAKTIINFRRQNDHGYSDIGMLPMPNTAYLIVEPAFKLLFEHYGIIFSEDYKLTVQHSEKYKMYKTVYGEIYGLKVWQGQPQWKQLKLHTFFSHRIDDPKKVEELIEKIRHIQMTYDEGHFEYVESLSEGYNNTSVSSCMKGNGEYFKIFEDSGRLLTYNYQGIHGRAIVWHKECLEGLPDGCEGFMDRIYPSENHKIVESFKAYAKKHKFAYKLKQSYEYKHQYVFQNKEYENTLSLKAVGEDNGCYPYMDSFTFSNDLQWFHTNPADCRYKLSSTDGDIHGLYQCSCCGYTSIHEDDFYYVDGEPYCSDCHRERFFTCEQCGDSFDLDDVIVCDGDRYCPDCADRLDIRYCEDTDRCARECYFLEDKEYYVEHANNCYEWSNGLYYSVEEEKEDE